MENEAGVKAILGIYIALFGRPADPAGLEFFVNATNGGQDLTAIGNLSGQPEYLGRFPDVNDRDGIIRTIYLNLFERPADDAEVAEWLKIWDEQGATVNDIAIRIQQSARGVDVETINAKIEAAILFLERLDTDAEQNAYQGTFAASVGRDYINAVDGADDAATVEDADEAILRLFPDEGNNPGGGGGGGNEAPTVENVDLNTIYIDREEVERTDLRLAAAEPNDLYAGLFANANYSNGILSGDIPVALLLQILRAEDPDGDDISIASVIAKGDDAFASLSEDGQFVSFRTPINAVSGLDLEITDGEDSTTATIDLGLALVEQQVYLDGNAVKPNGDTWQGTGGNTADNFHRVTTQINDVEIEISMRGFVTRQGTVPYDGKDQSPYFAAAYYDFDSGGVQTARYGFSLGVTDLMSEVTEPVERAVADPTETSLADLIDAGVRFELRMDTDPSAITSNELIFVLEKETLLPALAEVPVSEDSGYSWRLVNGPAGYDGSRDIVDDEGESFLGPVTQNAGTPLWYLDLVGKMPMPGDYSVSIRAMADTGVYAGLDVQNTVILGISEPTDTTY